MHYSKKYWLYDLIALFAGLALPLAFAPFHYSVIAILSPALLLSIWLHASPKQAFWRGWLFGLGFFGLGIYWVYISLRVYGNASLFFATLTTVLLIAAYSLFFAVFGFFLNYFFPKNTVRKLLLVFPASWTLLEWIRSWLFTGFPWLSLGYSQISSPLRGLAPVFGIYGVSFATVFTAAALVTVILLLATTDRIRQAAPRLVAILLSVTLLWTISFILIKKVWTHPFGPPLKVSLVQGNIPQEQKWQAENVNKILALYLQLTRQHLDSDMIVWPEAAIVVTDVDAKDYLALLNEMGKKNHVAILAGIPVYKNFQYYNALIALGDGSGEYFKHHLLPFGDYIPLRFIFNLFNRYVQIPMSDFSPGALPQPPLLAKNIKVAAFICYEIVFPEEVIKSLPEAQLLVLVTDDSWFGKSFASEQHLQMGQMRALETGRYLLFTGNSGITAIINAQGQVQAIAPAFQQYVLSGLAQPLQGSTPYVWWGNYPVVFICFILLIACCKPITRTFFAKGKSASNDGT